MDWTDASDGASKRLTSRSSSLSPWERAGERDCLSPLSLWERAGERDASHIFVASPLRITQGANT